MKYILCNRPCAVPARSGDEISGLKFGLKAIHSQTRSLGVFAPILQSGDWGFPAEGYHS